MTDLEEVLEDEHVEFPVVDGETVFSGRVWDVARDTVAYGEGTITREYVRHGGAVAVVAIDDEDRVLLIKQYRHPVRSRLWEVPAGLLDIAGEPPLAAVQRELAEEADVQASQWSVLAEYYTTPGSSSEAIRIYLARGITPTGETFARHDEEADMEVRWVPLADAVDAVLARRIQNPSLVVGLLAAEAARARGWRTLGAADEPWARHPGTVHPGVARVKGAVPGAGDAESGGR